MVQTKGKVRSVIFHTGSYYILDFEETSGHRVTVKGNLFGISRVVPGVPLVVSGRWARNPKYGRQIQITSWDIPEKAQQHETVAFLENAVGFSFDTARDVWGAFGEDTLSTLSKLSAEKIHEACPKDPESLTWSLNRWTRLMAIRALSEVLKEGGLTSLEIEQAVTKFGSGAPLIIQENPFRLMEIPGFSFERVDTLALQLGHGFDNPQRLEGAALWALNEAGRNGHLYLQRGDIPTQALDLKESMGPLPIQDSPDRGFKGAIQNLQERGALVLDGGAYLPEYHEYERASAALIAKLMTPSALQVELTPFLEEFERSSQLELSEAQQEAVEKLLDKKFLVLTGLPGTGKCVVRNTLVSGPWGFREIGSFVPGDTLVSGIHPLEDTWVDTSKGVRRAAYSYNGGVSDTVKIRTKAGFGLEGTPEHPIRVLRHGVMQWVLLRDVAEGDIAILVKGSESYSFSRKDPALPSMCSQDTREVLNSTPSHMTESLALILGVLTSEGSVKDTNIWTLTARDPNMLSLLGSAFEECFGFRPCYHRDRRYDGGIVGYRIHRTALIRWFRQLGVNPELSGTKSIPACILEATRPNVRSYLKALFEEDGSVDATGCSIEYGTASEKLAYQVQTLLLAFGVVATRVSCSRGGKPFYRLGIYGEDYDRFRADIGFLVTDLPARLRASNTNKHLLYGVSSFIADLMREVRPRKGCDYNRFYRYSKVGKSYCRNPSRDHVLLLLSYAKEATPTTKVLHELSDPKWFFDPVVSVAQGKGTVVDFGVPEDHEFLSSGFVSHNTTAVKALVRLFEVSRVSFALMAPTGIASKRLAHVTGHTASTIHRALGYDGNSWQKCRDNKFVVDAVIVDEVSMVDQELLYRLLSALRSDTMVVLVGDDAQLPSVGPGNVLRELVSCSAVPNVRLTQIFRQSTKGAIVSNSHLINNGQFPVLGAPKSDSEFRFIPISNEEKAREYIVKMALKLKERGANFQVLSPKYEGPIGVNSLNNALRDVLNPPGPPEWSGKFRHFRLGDRIMVVKNNYTKGVYNGDVGKLIHLGSDQIVLRIYGVGNELDQEVRFTEREADDCLRLAYAITVHKSQGSEFDTVILPVMNSQGRMLQRNLLYTAVTRAKKRVWLVGEDSAIQRAIENNKVIRRNTSLAEAIDGVLEGSHGS